ncbi:MAG: 2-amino-4-hydroxy-6-hydroxymethyldihydropteridine diphosphokinase [Planctomycetes bacterium]|nr:2-amino-4-hydroxy-6-hydroxymethyldihydropteridine diphosphokinase [Planctomycetota bacterium]
MDPASSSLWHIGLGSNLGDRLANLDAARDALRSETRIEIQARSRVYETAPVGGPANQGPYLNAALALRTPLSAEALLRTCQSIEQRLGRRREVPDGPRTIDLDLLLCGDRIYERPDLILPHPRLHQRRFVLEPLAEIAADVVHPTLSRTVAWLLTNLEPAEVTGQTCRRVSAPGWD